MSEEFESQLLYPASYLNSAEFGASEQEHLEYPELYPELESSDGEASAPVNRASREYIAWVQRALNKALGLRLGTDGIMGPQTRSAVRSFQQRQGLKVDEIGRAHV